MGLLYDTNGKQFDCVSKKFKNLKGNASEMTLHCVPRIVKCESGCLPTPQNVIGDRLQCANKKNYWDYGSQLCYKNEKTFRKLQRQGKVQQSSFGRGVTDTKGAFAELGSQM